ncbi:hypothetical protein V8E53_001296 [Lactarius tabidus]
MPAVRTRTRVGLQVSGMSTRIWSTVAYTTRARLAWRRTRISSTPQPWPTRRLTASAVWGEGLRSPSGEQRPGDTTLPLFRRSLGHCSPWHDEILPLSRCDPIGGWFLGPLRSPNTRIILLRLPPSTNSAAARITACRSALAAWADQTYSYIVICAALLAAAFPTLLLGNSIYSSILNSTVAGIISPINNHRLAKGKTRFMSCTSFYPITTFRYFLRASPVPGT